jgi:hypothetical protein
MTAEKRRALFESIRERMIAAGFGFEDDPAFLDAVEKWIAEELTSAQLRQEYLNLLYSREDVRWMERKSSLQGSTARRGQEEPDVESSD